MNILKTQFLADQYLTELFLVIDHLTHTGSGTYTVRSLFLVLQLKKKSIFYTIFILLNDTSNSANITKKIDVHYLVFVFHCTYTIGVLWCKAFFFLAWLKLGYWFRSTEHKPDFRPKDFQIPLWEHQQELPLKINYFAKLKWNLTQHSIELSPLNKRSRNNSMGGCSAILSCKDQSTFYKANFNQETDTHSETTPLFTLCFL